MKKNKRMGYRRIRRYYNRTTISRNYKLIRRFILRLHGNESNRR